MLQQIPQELRLLKQWVVSGPDKLPLDPRTGKAASVTDPTTWASFEEAIRAGYKNVGFVLSKDDPYTIIDLDNKPDHPLTEEQITRHSKIVAAIDSYTEYSVSGRGLHIIVRGKIPQGVKRDQVEVYSDARYMVCTGNVYKNLPIADFQELLTILFNEMGGNESAELEDCDSPVTDAELYDMASNAANADKFNRLCIGEWEGEYQSQSEADLALLSMFAFYSRDNEQVRRLFRMSALGQRDKATRDDRYINYALRKIRAKQPELIDLSELVERTTRETNPVVSHDLKFDELQRKKPLVDFPQGLIGEVAEYILASSIRPVKEIALAAALGLVAGIVGRSYNISGQGLNQYLILLAKTGSGKEGAASGIDSIIGACRQQIPMADQFMGPGAYASGQALIRVLDKKPCFVSVLGEVGLTLQQLCDPRAPAATIMLKKVLLDLYSKSGWNKVLQPSVYSDQEKNTMPVRAPNVTILGESTPETFYGKLDQTHIAEGLVPRFIVLEYQGKRPPRNPNAFFAPPESLVNKVCDLITTALSCEQNNSCAPVQLDPVATQILADFDKYADSQINGTNQDIQMQLWNRAHLKALKLSALIAVGVNHHQPIVTREMAQWACQLVTDEVTVVLDRFTSGDVGTGDHKQESDLRAGIKAYLQMTADQRKGYKISDKLASEPIIPYTFLSRWCKQRTSFKEDRRGANVAIQMALDEMVKADVIGLMPVDQTRRLYRTSTPIYVLGQAW